MVRDVRLALEVGVARRRGSLLNGYEFLIPHRLNIRLVGNSERLVRVVLIVAESRLVQLRR